MYGYIKLSTIIMTDTFRASGKCEIVCISGDRERTQGSFQWSIDGRTTATKEQIEDVVRSQLERYTDDYWGDYLRGDVYDFHNIYTTTGKLAPIFSVVVSLK